MDDFDVFNEFREESTTRPPTKQQKKQLVQQVVAENCLRGICMNDLKINADVKKRISSLPCALPYMEQQWKGIGNADFNFVLLDDGDKVVSLKEHFRYVRN
jgi:phosphopantothenate synthetase